MVMALPNCCWLLEDPQPHAVFLICNSSFLRIDLRGVDRFSFSLFIARLRLLSLLLLPEVNIHKTAQISQVLVELFDSESLVLQGIRLFVK